MKSTADKIYSWQKTLIEAVTDPHELLKQLNLDASLLPAALIAGQHFTLKVPQSFLNRMEKGNLQDPLLQQVLPIGAELLQVPGYSHDPLQEKQFNPVPGLLHKYKGRVLLTLSSSCGINCRYCFRRHFNYEENNPGSQGWVKALDYIATDSSITEVILSGGDPLVVPDHTLLKITERLDAIPHVKRLRIHSRMPIVLPERVTPEFIAAVTAPSLKTILVVHSNHPQELNDEVKTIAKLLSAHKIALLNQTVLLRGINDRIETLCDLSEALFEMNILPYYLHVLDKVQGAAHFDLDRQIALQLHQGITERLSGYLVPKLVCEQPGSLAKTLLIP